MRWHPQTAHRPRRGKVLVLTAFSVVPLLGMVGMTVDTGLLQTARRTAQNAADAGSLAAAMELYRGNTLANAQTIATSYIQKCGLTDPAVTIAVQVPQSGPYKGNTNYVEVIVTAPQSVYLMPILGVSSPQTVAARSVAGYEQINSNAEAIVLLGSSAPDLSMGGTDQIKVNGSIVVNASGGGEDQYGNNIGSGTAAIKTNGTPIIEATAVFVHGGVSDPSVISNYVSGGPAPLFANVATVVADPLSGLPLVSASNDQYSTKNYGAVTVSNGQTLQPGIYNDISINNMTNVTFAPGIYILSPSSKGQGLNISGGKTSIEANGVMFYSAWSGWPNPPGPGTVYASLNLGGGTPSSINMTGLSAAGASTVFNGLLFYQPSINTNDVSVAANANLTLNGTVYAPSATLTTQGGVNITGSTRYVLDSMSLGGNNVLTIPTGPSNLLGTANQVFLVE
jgi:Flp pilus assembly protein TadG